MVYVLLGTGFETIEALAAVNTLRRGGTAVTMVGVDGMAVSSSHNIVVAAECAVDAVRLEPGDMVVLPGGLGGVNSIEKSEAAMALVRQAAEDRSMWLAAICAAPAMLARRGLLPAGARAVCYPGMEGELVDAGVVPCMDCPAVRDGRLITGRAPGAAYEFALALLAALAGEDTARRVRADMCC